MDAHVKTIVTECTRDSDAGTAVFPQIVARLMEAGVESYFTDFRRSSKIYYMPSGDSCAVDAEPVDATLAKDFSAAGVEASVRASQAQQIDYKTFCRRVIAAGCVGYIVSLAGRRAVYFGRTGETQVELFPGT